MKQETWAKAWDFEVGFWRSWFATHGLEWPEEYKARLDPTRPLQPVVGNRLPVGEHRILDVGAGPLTVLGKVWFGQPANIVAVDPLAKAYDQLLEQFKIVPLVRTQEAYVESLSETFPENSFDVVHMMNALDHSRDPLVGIYELVKMARPGGYVVLSHATKEATRHHHSGMHQWDLSIDHAGHYILAGEGASHDMTEALASRQIAEMTQAYGDEKWHWVVFKKVLPA
jgi:SAM-dependent methyltransferase